MAEYLDISQAVRQVRSEMRFALARETPRPPIMVANAYLCRLDLSTRTFKFRLHSEQRRDPEMQRLLRDLHRLYEDLLHFYGHSHAEVPAQPEIRIVLPAIDILSAILIGKLS